MSVTAFERFQNRRDPASVWTSKNPILLAGEMGFELDTGRFKLGDGTTTWNNLKYADQPYILLNAGDPYPNPAPPTGTLVLRLL